MENGKILIGILAIIGIVLISGCVEEKPEVNESINETLDQTKITKEQAIAIANSTIEVQEFLKLYPDANVSAIEVNGSFGIVYRVYGIDDDRFANVTFAPDINYSDPPGWLAAYWKGDVLSFSRYSSAVRVGINAKSDKILAKYPKLEYIKNSKYCEKDSDCSTPKDEHGYACWDCVNFIHLAKGVNPVDSCRMPAPLNCKCINNTCTAVTNKTEIQSKEDEENTSNQEGINKSSEIINSGPIAKGTVINLASEDKVAFFFLYNPGCIHCSRAEVHIPEIQEMFGGRVIIYKLLVRSPESEPWKQMAKDSGLASYPLTLSVGHKSTKNGTVDESKIGMTQSSGSSKYLQWKENICKQFKDQPSVCDDYL